jgi:hypothetical protein
VAVKLDPAAGLAIEVDIVVPDGLPCRSYTVGRTPYRYSHRCIDEPQGDAVRTRRGTARYDISLEVRIARVVYSPVPIRVEEGWDLDVYGVYMMLRAIELALEIGTEEVFLVRICRVDASPAIERPEEEETKAVISITTVRSPGCYIIAARSSLNFLPGKMGCPVWGSMDRLTARTTHRLSIGLDGVDPWQRQEVFLIRFMQTSKVCPAAGLDRSHRISFLYPDFHEVAVESFHHMGVTAHIMILDAESGDTVDGSQILEASIRTGRIRVEIDEILVSRMSMFIVFVWSHPGIREQLAAPGCTRRSENRVGQPGIIMMGMVVMTPTIIVP